MCKEAKSLISDLKHRQHQIMVEKPEVLKYDPNDLNDPNLDINAFYASILVFLTHALNVFFIERLRLIYGAADTGDLLSISFDMVTATVTLWQHKDRFKSMRRNFEWLVRKWSLPPMSFRY